MGLPDIDTALSWVGRSVIDRDGEKIGSFDEIYLDSETDRPEWAAVKSGLLGRRRSLVPLSEARPEGDDLRVPFEKAHVEAAPAVEPDSELSQDEEAALYEHYGVSHSQPGATSVRPDEGASGADTGRLGPGARPRERVRIKRYVVTEHVRKTVPVQHEELRLEPEQPPPAGGRGSDEPSEPA